MRELKEQKGIKADGMTLPFLFKMWGGLLIISESSPRIEPGHIRVGVFAMMNPYKSNQYFMHIPPQFVDGNDVWNR